MRATFQCAVTILFMMLFPLFTSAFQYDIEKGLLLKLDSFLQIQLGKTRQTVKEPFVDLFHQ